MRSLKFLLFFVLFSVAAFGQGATATGNPVVVNGVGQPMAGVTVAICNANPGTSPATLCSGTGLATLYTDITVTTACTGTLTALNNQTNPTVGSGCSNPGLSDGQGNVVAFSTAGTYWCEYTGSNIVGIAVGVCVFPALSGGASLVGDNVSIQVAGGVISATNPFNVGTVVSTSPNGISAVLFNGPDPFCMYNNLGQDQLSDCLDPANGSSVLAWNPDGKRNRRMFSTIMGSSPFTPGESVGYDPNYGDFRIGAPIALPNGIQGENWISGLFVGIPSPEAIKVSGYCNSGYTGGLSSAVCIGYADEAHALKAIQSSVNCTSSNNSSCEIVDDLTGTQYWTEEPFANSFTGQLFIRANGPAHQILVDGMSTVTLPTSTQMYGMGGSSSDQIGENTQISMCNNLTDYCPQGGFVTQNTSATTIALSASGAITTVTLTAGAPFSTSTGAINQLTANRWVCISGATSTIWDGCFTVAAVTHSGAPQVFTLNTDSTTQTGSCAAPCTAAVAVLDTPLLSFGVGGGGGAYGTRFGNMVLDCHGVIGGFGFVNGQGEEGTGTDGFLNIFNCPQEGFHLEQSGIYGGNGSIGTTNAGTYANITINYNPWIVTKPGGAPCSNTSVADCSAGGIVPQGSAISFGAGTSGFGILTPNPALNPNWMCAQITGTNGNQGSGDILRLTCSSQDKTASNASVFLPNGASQPTGVVVVGQHASFGDVHTEFMRNAFDICGDSAINASLYEAYGSVLTSGVNFHSGGFIGFASGGLGMDIGTSGNGALCMDINILGMNIGAQSGTILKDNIYGITLTGSASEQVVTYTHGHGGTYWGSSPAIGIAPGRISMTNLLIAVTAPTITGHFNTSGDSISANNGTAAFTVTVGTGSAGSTGTVGLPTAATGWVCFAANRNRGAYIQQTGSSATSATFTNFGTTVGSAVNWTNSDVLAMSCHAY